MTESGVTIDYAQLVIDDEFARMIKQIVGGIPVSDETLAIDDIHTVGPFGDFLSLDATMRHMRAQSQPQLMDRRVREDWLALGAPTMYDTARAAAARILAEQNLHFCAKVSDRAFVIDKGSVKYEGTMKDLLANDEVKEKYLAV